MESISNRPLADQVAFADRATFLLKRCGNRDRLRILVALREGEHSVRDLEDRLHVRQPALSQQLAELRRSGLIAGRKASKHVFYRLVDERAVRLIDMVTTLFGDAYESAPAVARPVRPPVN